MMNSPIANLRALKSVLFERLGLYVRRRNSLPFGVLLEADLARLFPAKSPSAVFDVGANFGQSARYFRRIFPEASIFSFEPVRDTYQMLTNTVNDKNTRFFQCALGAHDGRIEIPLNANPAWNSLSPKALSRLKPTGFEEIVVRRLDTIVSELNLPQIDLLKLDVEGFEIQALEGGRQLLLSGRAPLIFSEVGFQSQDHHHTNLWALNDFLSQFSYSLVAIYDQSPTRQGAKLNYANALFRQDCLFE